jgi:peptidoglycan/LPS O-acetylase OafA/YrhL
MAYAHEGDILQLAIALWGPHAAEPGNDSFFSWLVWFSPGRLHEFLGGVIAAQVFVLLNDRPVSLLEERIGLVVLTAGLLALAFLQVGLQSQWRPVLAAASPFIVPIATGQVIFCCSRYKTRLSRSLATSALVICGDASYAIYLLHLKFLQIGAAGRNLPLTTYFVTHASVRFALTVILLIVVSIGLYRVLESPARRAVRGYLSTCIERIEAAPYAIIGCSVGIPLLLAIGGWILTFS